MLSGTARAGEIPSTGVVAPPPSTLTTTGETPGTGAPAPQALLMMILTFISIGR